MNRTQFILILALVLSSSLIQAQPQREKGPVIKDYGSTYPVPSPDYTMDKDAMYKVVFDITYAPEDPSELNKALATPARFLNMHVAAGKDLSTLKPVMVVHGGASYGLLKNEFYKEKYGVDNPNIALMTELMESGVDVYLCGQTAAHREINEERRLPGVGVGLSAMTILIELQQQGFVPISLK